MADNFVDYVGTVVSWNGAKGYGFISCANLDNDAFFSKADLPVDAQDVQSSFLAGRPVRFQGEEGKNGKTKASGIVIVPVENGPVPGCIKSFSETKGYGFINSTSLDGDVFFKREDLPPDAGVFAGALGGQAVLFSVREKSDGKLYAEDISLQAPGFAPRHQGGGGNSVSAGPPGRGGGFAGALISAGPAAGRGDPMMMHGTVKMYNSAKGYGFVSAMDLQGDMKFGRADLPEGMIVVTGTEVGFQCVAGSDGRLQARNLTFGPPQVAAVQNQMGSGAATVSSTLFGTVKMYNEEKGYGFITTPGTPVDIKFGRTDCHGPVAPGSKVSFEAMAAADGRLQAQAVVPVQPGVQAGCVAAPQPPPRPAAYSDASVSMLAAGLGGSYHMLQQDLEQGALSGTVKMYNEVKGYGFITIPGQMGDVKFGRSDVLSGDVLKSGEHVVFDPKIGPDGRLQACNVSSESAAGGPAHWAGVVKMYKEDKGYGFINLPGIKADIKFGRSDLTADAAVYTGAEVFFGLERCPNGRMRAHNVGTYAGGVASEALSLKRQAHDVLAVPAPKAAKVHGLGTATGEFASGKIKAFNTLKGFGFITSPHVAVDVFFLQSGLPEGVPGDQLVGENVSFEIVYTDDGKTRANHISPISALDGE